MTEEHKQWLADNIDIWQRQKETNDKFLNDREKAMLTEIAKAIDGDDTELSIHCVHCRQKLIRIVFSAYEMELEESKTNNEYEEHTN